MLFVFVELRTEVPLIKVRIFADRAFTIDNAVLFFAMMAFVPLFFFASVYSQVSLGLSANGAGLYLLIFFAGFVVAAQIGGRMLDRGGAKLPVILGCLIGAVGFGLWAWKLTDAEPGQRSGHTSCSPAPASASCWGRPAPTRSTGRSTRRTARSPA